MSVISPTISNPINYIMPVIQASAQLWGLLHAVFLEDRKDHLVRRPDLIIDLGKPPHHHPLLVDHQGCRVRDPARAAGVKQAVTIYDLMLFVLKKPNGERGGVSIQFRDERLGVFMRFWAYCQDLDFVFPLLVEQALQLAKLIQAVGSPLAPIEDQNYPLFPAVIGERHRRSVMVFQRKIGGDLPNLDPSEINSREVVPIFRAERLIGFAAHSRH